MSVSRPKPAEDATVAGSDPAQAASSASVAPPARSGEADVDETSAPDAVEEPGADAAAPDRADPLAAAMAVVVMVVLLACAAIVLIASGNA